MVERAQKIRRWQMAHENHTASQHTLQHGFYGACVSRSYYACFQAMWVALGDPPLGRWEHGGVMRTFCRGQWANPILLPTSLAPFYKRLLTLYDLRLDADYRALPVTPEKAQEAVQTVAELFRMITQHTVVEQENPL